MEKKRRKEWASQSKNEETYHKNRQSNWHTISVFIFFYFKQINRALPNTISIRTEVCETKEKRTKKYNKCRGRRNASLLVVFFSASAQVSSTLFQLTLAIVYAWKTLKWKYNSFVLLSSRILVCSFILATKKRNRIKTYSVRALSILWIQEFKQKLLLNRETTVRANDIAGERERKRV